MTERALHAGMLLYAVTMLGAVGAVVVGGQAGYWVAFGTVLAVHGSGLVVFCLRMVRARRSP